MDRNNILNDEQRRQRKNIKTFFEMGSQLIKVFILRCWRTKRSGAEIVWFGVSSPRGYSRLKTTLHGWTGLIVNG